MSARHSAPAKALGTPAKKRLEYWPEPTSLRPRNRPEMVPRHLKRPERSSKEQGSQRLAAPASFKSERRNSERRNIWQTEYPATEHPADGTYGRRDRKSRP